VEKRYYRCRSLAQRSARAIVAGIKTRVPEAPFQKSCYAFARLEKHGASQSSKRWIVNSNCTLCGLCESQCPSANISIQDGKHVFGEKCLLCLRGWWNCPVRAIDHKFLHPFLLKEPYTLPED
jgi:ferredoxin